MPSTDGFVGTIEVETRGVSRIWFSLTDEPTGSDWVRIGNPRAWFTMNLETGDRPYELAKLTLLLEAQRNGLVRAAGQLRGGWGEDPARRALLLSRSTRRGHPSTILRVGPVRPSAESRRTSWPTRP